MEAVAQTACTCSTTAHSPCQKGRSEAIRAALRLEYLTIGWNIVEGVIAVGAALAAGSVAILGFGIDSFVECASGIVMLWRLRAEHTKGLSGAQLERSEHRALKLIAGSLCLLAGYVAIEASRKLWTGERPQVSIVGIALLLISIALMLWLARAKRILATRLNSNAMAADAFQTTACWWLSVTALTGVTLNGLFDWWWADPIAAMVIAVIIAREAHASWNGMACRC